MVNAAARAEEQRLELVTGLAAAAAALRTSCDSFKAAADVMAHCAQVADNWAAGLSGTPVLPLKGKRKADDDDDLTANGKRKRTTKKKDPNAPKRPASSYLLFQNEVRKEIKAQFPQLSNTELLNVVKTNWNEMSEEQKAVYHDKMTKDKERYNAEKTAYEARSPAEVARMDAEVEAAIALKKATPRGRKPKAVVAAVPAPAAAAPSSPEQSEDDDDDDDDDDQHEVAVIQQNTSTAATSESESESDDESEEEHPAPKKAKIAPPPPPPAPVVKEKKKKNKA